MKGFSDDINVDDKAEACVEPAPKVGLIVRFGGKECPIMLAVGGLGTIRFGTFEVEVEVVEVTREKIRPAKAPPYHWTIKTASRVASIRAMDEENARRLFHRGSGCDEDILEIYPEMS